MYRLEKNKKNNASSSREQVEKFLVSPSFSSTLLDQIYRSIDQDAETKNNSYTNQQTTSFYKQTDTKHNKKVTTVAKETNNYRNSHSRQQQQQKHETSISSNSSSSSSSYCSSGLFSSSSDTDSYLSRAPKPVRTSASSSSSFRFDGLCRNYEESKHDTEEAVLMIKNKSRALKIYNNLKKVKQPISPGGKLTSFLNSLLKTNKKKSDENYKASTCSSARSCLSKTTSLTCAPNKTVRFVHVEEKESNKVVVKETARKFLEEYRNNNKKNDLVLKDLKINQNKVEDYEDDDDVASCASSDLFELDHLDVFGSARYCEELPVYETTRVSTVF